MKEVNVALDSITIRHDLRPGDVGHVIYRHGKLYGEEYNFGVEFEMYVASGMIEFHKNYNPEVDRVWICEHNDKTVGFLLLMHRENNSAQLRYFYVERAYRGIGLGRKLMEMYMDFLRQRGYHSSFLWTTHELDTAAALYRKQGFKLTEEKPSTAFGIPLKEQRYDLVLC